jgi:superfamily II helicase
MATGDLHRSIKWSKQPCNFGKKFLTELDELVAIKNLLEMDFTSKYKRWHNQSCILVGLNFIKQQTEKIQIT